MREGADLGLCPNAKFCKNRLSGWALSGKLITKIAKFDGFEFLWYGFLLLDTCLTVILLHDYCTQTYINLHKLLTLHCNFICVLSVVIIKTDDDDDDDD